MVFSSTGDITRSKNSAGQNATPVRSGILVRRKLLDRAVSAATVALQGAFPSDRRLRDTLLQNISRLRLCLGARPKRRERDFHQSERIARAALNRLSEIDANLASDLPVGRRARVSEISLPCPQCVENFRGAFEVAHLNQRAVSSVPLVDDVLAPGTTASECARVFGKAVAKQVRVAAVAPGFENYAKDFEAEPEQEFAVQAR